MTCPSAFTCFLCGTHFLHSSGVIKEHPANAPRFDADGDVSLCDDCDARYKQDWYAYFGKPYPYGSDMLGEDFK